MEERRVIDVCSVCGFEQSTIDMAIDHYSVEDFGRASIRKEDNSNTTCELTILILSVSVTFSVTFV